MFHAVYRKTVGDLSDPKTVIAYLLGFAAVLWFLSLGFTNDLPDAMASLPVEEQVIELQSVYLAMSWFWAVGLALLTAGAVFVALTIATEAERGTLDLVLSKPVPRWKVLGAVFVATLTYLFALAVASVLLAAVALYQMGGFSAAALGGGVFDVLPATLLFALVVTALISAIGTLAGVLTRSRLQTAAVTAVAPVLFLGLFVARVFPGTIYDDYYLWVVDVGYHLGNVYVLLLETMGGSIPPEVQATVGFWTGVYELPSEGRSGGESLDLIGHVDPWLSLALCLALTAGLLALATAKFQRLEV